MYFEEEMDLKIKIKSLLSLFLIVWVILSLYLLVHLGPFYIGKTYFTSDNFETKLNDFKNDLGRYVLSPLDVEDAKKKITVTKEEIDHHRYYYGSLTEQIEDIRMQYEERIQDTTDSELQEMIMKERDAKIADIKKNFEDDAHVEEKVRKQKEQIIDDFVIEEKRYMIDFLEEYNFFAYSLKNTKTGEKFESGDINESSIFKMKFGKGKPYLIIDSSKSIEPDEYNDTLLNSVIHYPGEMMKFEGTISIPKSMMNQLHFKEDYQSFNIGKMILYIILGTGLFAIIGLLTVFKPSLKGFLNDFPLKQTFLKLPVDVRIIVTLLALLITELPLNAFVSFIRANYYFFANNLLQSIFELIIYFSLIMLFTSATILGGLWTWESINSEEKIKTEWKKSILYRLSYGIQDLFLNRSIGCLSVIMLTVVFVGGFGLAAVFISPESIFFFGLFCFFIAIPVTILFLSLTGYLNRIIKQTKDMSEGRLTSEVKVKGKSPLAQHATNLNALREGVRHSLLEQAKSERLKTELITNVSHDLRTPLTSIITYTDLLKNPDLTEEERKKYIEVLDKKSARLKTLIEDLFEVSKMSSGNIELNRQRVDLSQLLQQAIGEHEESFEKANLEIRVTLPNEPLYANVDGQKWWRVIDNLITNALKYSLKGTRVYVTLRKVQHAIELSVKNIANYELGDNVDELTERFKRADESRHTDGSGLGLAISQSIVDLHGGTMKIEVDGDLFKVTVTIETD